MTDQGWRCWWSGMKGDTEWAQIEERLPTDGCATSFAALAHRCRVEEMSTVWDEH